MKPLDALRELHRAAEETVTAGHPTGSLLTALVWSQKTLQEHGVIPVPESDGSQS